jgi:hypothetical protein
MAFSICAFRSVEQWKTAIITLPDTHFFDLMRSTLGNIQSPFNKQRLLDDLTAFLSNKNIQKTIAAYIDEDDHRIIAAIASLNEPDIRELSAFFSGEYSYAKIASLVINLEERLIVYGIGESGRLSLNPLLKKILLPFAADTKILFPCVRDSDSPRPASVFDDLYLASFITLIAPEKHIVRADGVPRKNLLRKIQKTFPVKGDGAEVFAAALRCIGILTEDTLNYYGQKLRDFTRLSEQERFAYCAAGFYISLTEDSERLLLPQKNHIRHIASIAVSLLDSLDGDNVYPEQTLRRLLDIRQNEQAGGRESGSAAEVNKPLVSTTLLDAMEKTGLLVKVSDGYRKRKERNSAGDSVSASEVRVPVIVFNSLFSFVLLPEITFQDIISLAPFCEVDDARGPVQFKLTQASAVHGFNNGIPGKTMFEILKKLSAVRIDAGLETMLDEWEKKHSEIVIMEGISIVLSEGRRYITETEPLASHIVLNPSPGVYLLDFTEKEEAAAALKKAGVEMVSDPRSGAKPASLLQRRVTPFFAPIPHQTAPLNAQTGIQPSPVNSTHTDEGHPSAEEYKHRFRAILDGLKPSKLELEELAARIDRRLVISPAQLKGAFIRYERREVHGLDYAGKLSMVKQALLSNEMLEIIIQDSDGSEKYIRGIPFTLVKTGGETVLSVKLLEDDEFDDSTGEAGRMEISMGKIRTVRRIKRSIFTKERG